MLSKLTMSLAVAMSLLLTNSAFAQQTQKTDAKALQATADTNAKLAAEIEGKRLAEIQTAAEKLKAEESTGVLGYIKTHFSASYLGDFSFTRKDITSVNEADHDIQNFNIIHNPAITYRPTPNVKLSVSSEFRYSDNNTLPGYGSYINRYYRSLITLTRENVLTEADNGIGMSVSVVRRMMDRNHGAASSYGNNRVNTVLSKKFGDKLSTSLLVQYLANDPVYGKIDAKTWRHNANLLPTITFQITDKLSYLFSDDINILTPFISNDVRNVSISHEMNLAYLSYEFNDKNTSYFQLKYMHNETTDFTKEGFNDWFEYYVGHTYSFTPKFSLTAEVGSTIFAAHDGKDFFASDIKYPEASLYLSYAL